MADLLIHDSYECYYAGRDTGIRARPDLPVQLPKAVRPPSVTRERLLPVRLSDVRSIRRVRPS